MMMMSCVFCAHVCPLFVSCTNNSEAGICIQHNLNQRPNLTGLLIERYYKIAIMDEIDWAIGWLGNTHVCVCICAQHKLPHYFFGSSKTEACMPNTRWAQIYDRLSAWCVCVYLSNSFEHICTVCIAASNQCQPLWHYSNEINKDQELKARQMAFCGIFVHTCTTKWCK